MMVRPHSLPPAFPSPRRRVWCAVCAALVLTGGIAGAVETKAILFLQQSGPERSAMVEFMEGFRDELARQWPAPVAIRMEDISPDAPADATFDAWLEQKYKNRRIDLIAALEGPGTKLGVAFRNKVRPAAPMVLAGISAGRYEVFRSLPNVTGVTIDQNVRGLLEAAARLCPGTKHLFFVSGGIKTTEEERRLWRLDAEQFAAAEGMEFVDLTGPVTFAKLLEQVRAMPPHSLLLRRDTIVGGLTRASDRTKAMQQISEAANGPLFTIADAYAEDGSNGTGTVDYRQMGKEVGAQTVAVFKAGDASAVPPVPSAAFRLSFDWRQLQRWGLDEKRLPPGSDLRFRQPGLWEAHRGTMIGITAALAVQTALIIALLLQRRWRIRAESALRQQREQLSHTLRLATMTQMASSLAHELNQPLTAMVTNAGTARRMIARGGGDPAELGEILQDIAADGQRAGEVIRGIRGMVRRGETALEIVTVAELIVGVRRMIEPEARARGCLIGEEIAPGLPTLEVNTVQMQQVLLNLLMNAFDAMESAGSAARRVVIRAEAEGDATVCVSVRDFGPGLPPEGAEKLFEQYYTTKVHGLGMGLVIVRSIIEAHGGSLGAANADGGGARFYFRLPAVRRVAT